MFRLALGLMSCMAWTSSSTAVWAIDAGWNATTLCVDLHMANHDAAMRVGAVEAAEHSLKQAQELAMALSELGDYNLEAALAPVATELSARAAFLQLLINEGNGVETELNLLDAAEAFCAERSAAVLEGVS